jgi:hypothetical protein
VSQINENQGGIILDQVTPIHLCETLELVNKKFVSEYLLYFENCADNVTLTTRSTASSYKVL